MSIEQVDNAVEIAANKLSYMESLYEQVKDQVNTLQYTIEGLLKNIEALKYKISILDKIAFACEQNCKRTEQQLQALTAKKDRLEKWIAKNSNNDELKHIVQANVKAALSENKQVLSIALTALLQTLKSDPQMINIIYKILTANHGEQYEDHNNNDNAIKYLESNKDDILDLDEKHYENLVEVLTDDSIYTAAYSNRIPSLPQSSSTFPNLATQSDNFRIEDSEICHNSKGDIAD
jgi:chromosome segregation ATPase